MTQNMKRWELEKHRARERKDVHPSVLRDKTTPAANTVPLELLAQDWLNEQQPSNEQRTYLIEHLLPSVVVGLDKLLAEVGVRGLVADKEENPDFNPVNYLAQHLMRNNPKHSDSVEAHPYYKAMQVIAEKLKNVVLTVDTEKLERLKSDIKKRRLERESAELADATETQRRQELLRSACNKWVLPERNGIITAEVSELINKQFCYVFS